MNTIKLQGTRRSDFGGATTRQLRSEGMVPGVIYGGEESIHFTTKKLDLRALVYTPQFQIAEIEIDGKTYRCILKDMQFDVINDELIHVDFLELVDGKKVIAELPIKFNGQPEGVKAGGRLVIKLKSVKVRTYPKYLKEALDVDINSLKLNGNVRVQDIVADNIEIMNPPRIPIASVVMTRALRQADNENKGAASGDAE
ncbi:MAG: 50S ribosomal protein L25 [Flavipsychrobacter sp.]